MTSELALRRQHQFVQMLLQIVRSRVAGWAVPGCLVDTVMLMRTTLAIDDDVLEEANTSGADPEQR